MSALSILGKIFGSGEVIKEGLQLVDDMHTSTEEEIAAKAAAKAQIMESYHPFKLAQRLLALMFATVFLSCFLLCLGFALNGDLGDRSTVMEVIKEFWIGEIMLMIIIFYFGGGTINSVKDMRRMGAARK